MRFLTSQEFKEYVDIHYHDNTPFAIAISKNNIELFKYLMFEYKIERTSHIKMILNYASHEILKVLETEKLSKELNSELNNNNNKERIMKI